MFIFDEKQINNQNFIQKIFLKILNRHLTLRKNIKILEKIVKEIIYIFYI